MEVVMSNSHSGFFLIIMVFVTVFFLSTAPAQTESWNMTIKGGLLFPGTVNIDPPGWDVDTEMGWMLNICGDAMVAPKLSLGGFIIYAGTSAEEFDESASIFTLGGTIKGRFTMQSGWQLRPGLAIGYQMIGGDAFEDVNGLDVGGIFEVVKPLANKKALVGELGFITQPSGGNDDADVTFGPIFYLNVGYQFGG